MIDIMYLVRPGNVNEELRYSLRSLQNVPHGDVWLVGHRPHWVRNVRHIPVPARDPLKFKYENATDNLSAIAERGPYRFALFNDDFFCVRPVDRIPPTGHRGDIRALAVARVGRYGKLLTDTADLLAELNTPTSYAYTLHKPMVMSADGLRIALARGREHGTPGLNISWRSLYGNLLRIGGVEEPDPKVHGPGPVPPGDWLSTSDSSFKYHAVGRFIRNVLPDPSPYET